MSSAAAQQAAAEKSGLSASDQIKQEVTNIVIRQGGLGTQAQIGRAHV